jgi:hypothetical protein
MTSFSRLSRLLTQFEKLDLGYTYDDSYGCMPSLSDSKAPKIQYPNLYVNRVKDDVMALPETGTALVEYKITGRNMNQRDGKKKYGMDVEIRSFDPQAGAKVLAKAGKPGAAKTLMLNARGEVTEFAGGYMNTHDGVQKERGVLAHLKRNAATYASIPLFLPTPADDHLSNLIPMAGAGIDRLLRKNNNIRKTSHEPKVDKKGRGLWRVQPDGKVIKFSDRTRDGDGQFVGAATGGADPVTMRQAYGKKALAVGAGAAALAGAGLLGGTGGGRKLASKGLKVAGGKLRDLRAALVNKSSGGRGKGFMQGSEKASGRGSMLQREMRRGA